MEKSTRTVLRGGNGGNAISLTRPWRKGQRYGSIIVDLQSHKILDLLPERTVESVIAWLQAHEEVEVVSRDRGGTYVDGATQGAPLAVQVCDRWHLMKNLGDAVEAYLIRKRVRIPDDPLKSAEGADPSPPVETLPKPISHRIELSQQRLRERQEICQCPVPAIIDRETRKGIGSYGSPTKELYSRV